MRRRVLDLATWLDPVTRVQPPADFDSIQGTRPPDDLGGPFLGLTPEQAVLRACALADVGESETVLARAAAEVTDWAAVRESALRHGLIALLHRRLRSAPPHTVPAPVLDELRALAVANERRSLFMGGQLLGLIGLLARTGIEALPYKGPVMAEGLYGDAGLRQSVIVNYVVPEWRSRHELAFPEEPVGQ